MVVSKSARNERSERKKATPVVKLALVDKNRPAKMQRPGGRTESVRKAVAVATLDLLGEGKLDFTVLDVVERSGVGRRTIHRRWPNRLALLREAFAEHNNALKVEFTDDFHRDLFQVAVALRDFLNNPHEIATTRVLVSTDDVDFRREAEGAYEEKATAPIIERIKMAQAAGEISSEVDAQIITLMFTSSIFARSFAVRNPLDDFELHALVSATMRMCRP